MKKILSLVATIFMMASLTVGFAGCTSSKPKITIELKDGREINYTLYRKYAPKTVEHFIKLCKDGYYDGVVISNVQATKVYAGNYNFVNENELFPKNEVATIFGEFANNGWTVDPNTMAEEAYTLSMFNPKTDTKNGASNTFFFTNTISAEAGVSYCAFGVATDKKSKKIIDDIFKADLAKEGDFNYQFNEKFSDVTMTKDSIIIKTIKVK